MSTLAFTDVLAPCPTQKSSEDFRNALGAFPTGVALVTAHTEHGMLGMTINSFSSVSLDPRLVLFCPAKSSATWAALRGVSTCAVSILSAQQESISRSFASRREDRFEGFDWNLTPSGHPVPADAAAWFDLRIVHTDESNAGDHDLVICEVTDWDAAQNGEPSLLFQGGKYGVPVLQLPGQV